MKYKFMSRFESYYQDIYICATIPKLRRHPKLKMFSCPSTLNNNNMEKLNIRSNNIPNSWESTLSWERHFAD